jgi:hypothetical protein
LAFFQTAKRQKSTLADLTLQTLIEILANAIQFTISVSAAV